MDHFSKKIFTKYARDYDCTPDSVRVGVWSVTAFLTTQQEIGNVYMASAMLFIDI